MTDGGHAKVGLHELVRNTRREKGLTQSELARLAGCRQSAISMFEGGRSDALSRKSLLVIGEKLGLDPEQLAAADGRTYSRDDTRLKFCPSDRCPSNVPYTVGSGLCFRPAMVRALSGVKSWCSMCGELLEDRCPNEQCGADVTEGAFCERCGTRYVTVTGTGTMEGLDSEAWADEQRRRIREIGQLGATRNRCG